MKVIHTGDWHLGHQLYGFDRERDHRRMLDALVETVAAERPDALLIAGDIFHTPNPPASAQRLFAESLVRFLDAAPGLVIVAIAGNHDSGSRHEIFRSLMLRQNVHLIGTTDTSDPSSHIIEIEGKGWIIAIPFTHRRNLPEGFIPSLTESVAARNAASLPVVLMAHTTVTGADLTGHEDRDGFTAGGIDATGIDTFGEGYDYLALGHIHKPQTIENGQRTARYSGTPVPVSFDETFSHSVSIVSTERHGEKPAIRCAQTDAGRPLITLPADGKPAPFEDALAMLRDYPDDIESLLRLNVLVDGFLPPEAMSRARAATEGKLCTLCTISAERVSAKESGPKEMSVQEFREASPTDVFARYAADCGVEMTDELRSMFDEAIESLNDEEDGK